MLLMCKREHEIKCTMIGAKAKDHRATNDTKTGKIDKREIDPGDDCLIPCRPRLSSNIILDPLLYWFDDKEVLEG